MFSSKKSNDTNTNVKTIVSPTPNGSGNINTIIGEGCEIKGGITSKNSVKIDGNILGDLNIDGSVIIGDKGHIQGDVRCADLVVFGRLDGNIVTQQLQLKRTAHIHGNIEAQSFQVEPGAVYQGSVSMKSTPAPQANESVTLDFSASASN